VQAQWRLRCGLRWRRWKAAAVDDAVQKTGAAAFDAGHDIGTRARDAHVLETRLIMDAIGRLERRGVRRNGRCVVRGGRGTPLRGNVDARQFAEVNDGVGERRTRRRKRTNGEQLRDNDRRNDDGMQRDGKDGERSTENSPRSGTYDGVAEQIVRHAAFLLLMQQVRGAPNDSAAARYIDVTTVT
jgi:hypothetical protein